jgi:hypothetical protein
MIWASAGLLPPAKVSATDAAAARSVSVVRMKASMELQWIAARED